MLGERIASQSEVIRAIVYEYSPCCGVPHRRPEAEASGVLLLAHGHGAHCRVVRKRVPGVRPVHARNSAVLEPDCGTRSGCGTGQ